MSLEEGKERIYCIDRRIALLRVLNVCNHVFGSVAGFAELIHWVGDGPSRDVALVLTQILPSEINPCIFFMSISLRFIYLLPSIVSSSSSSTSHHLHS